MKKTVQLINGIRLFYVILLLFFITISMSLYLIYGTIQADSFYYLGTSNSFLNGTIPYKDFNVEYPPLTFYIMSIPIYLSDKSYTVCLLCMYLFHIMDAFIVYLISRQNNISKFYSFYCAIFSLILTYYFGGEVYVLEPFVLFFGLLALLFSNKERLLSAFISGLFCFCSFWCKQYGIGFFFLCLVVYFFKSVKNRYFIRHILTFFAGFFTCSIFFLLILMIQGVSINDILILKGESYERLGGLSGVVSVWRTIFSILPLLPISILIVFVKYRISFKDVYVFVSLCAIIGFGLQWYVRTYWHYLIYMMPFCVYLLYKSTSLVDNKIVRNILVTCFLISVLRPSLALLQRDISLVKEDVRLKQESQADEVVKMLPFNSKNVYSSGDILPINLLNSYEPPLFKKYGYTNGFVLTSEETLELLEASDFCLISKYAMDTDTIKYNSSVKSYLNMNFDQVPIPDSDIILYKHKQK